MLVTFLVNLGICLRIILVSPVMWGAVEVWVTTKFVISSNDSDQKHVESSGGRNVRTQWERYLEGSGGRKLLKLDASISDRFGGRHF